MMSASLTKEQYLTILLIVVFFSDLFVLSSPSIIAASANPVTTVFMIRAKGEIDKQVNKTSGYGYVIQGGFSLEDTAEPNKPLSFHCGMFNSFQTEHMAKTECQLEQGHTYRIVLESGSYTESSTFQLGRNANAHVETEHFLVDLWVSDNTATIRIGLLFLLFCVLWPIALIWWITHPWGKKA